MSGVTGSDRKLLTRWVTSAQSDLIIPPTAVSMITCCSLMPSPFAGYRFEHGSLSPQASLSKDLPICRQRTMHYISKSKGWRHHCFRRNTFLCFITTGVRDCPRLILMSMALVRQVDTCLLGATAKMGSTDPDFARRSYSEGASATRGHP